MKVISPLPTGMRTDDALNFFAAALAFVFFPHGMAEFAELRAVFLSNSVLPAPHGPFFSLADTVAAAKEASVRESGAYHSVQAPLAESMLSAALFERAAPPVLGGCDCRG